MSQLPLAYYVLQNHWFNESITVGFSQRIEHSEQKRALAQLNQKQKEYPFHNLSDLLIIVITITDNKNVILS